MENSRLLLPYRLIKDELKYRIQCFKGNVDFNAILETGWKQEQRTRTDFLKSVLQVRTVTNYLEIGCATGKNLAAITAKNKVGVDPKSGGTLKITSDEYFSNQIEDNKFDLIFIDGLHTYEQVYRDFINSYNALEEGGIIVAHDFLPTTFREQMVPRVSRTWNGDVWRLALDLRDHGVQFKIVNMDYGLLLVKNAKLLEDIESENKNTNFQSYIDFIKGNDTPICTFDEGLEWIK